MTDVLLRQVWVLRLASVYSNVDDLTSVGVFDSLEAGEAWEQEQRAPEPYVTEPAQDDFGQTHHYNLVYREDSSLHWYNPPDAFGAGWHTVAVPDDQ